MIFAFQSDCFECTQGDKRWDDECHNTTISFYHFVKKEEAAAKGQSV